MNDRFKFRVWNKNNKRYVDIFFDAHNHCWAYFIDQMGDLIAIEEDEDDVDRVQDKEIFVVEQCSGLKDKNGKLIYEGDVVRELFDDGSFMDRVVFYNELQCRWFIEYEFPCAPGDSAYWGLNSSKAKALEVIGNIHDKEQSK